MSEPSRQGTDKVGKMRGPGGAGRPVGGCPSAAAHAISAVPAYLAIMRAMEAPGITRHTRPFFAPLWFMPLAAVAVLLGAFALYRGANTTMVVLVQPTEKDPGTIDDPPASPEGEERAQRLARMFGSTGGVGRVDAIYVSDDRRAHQTAAPLAERL